tara:strand:+ start:13955 stop:14179 length:225 start_codon:yes stop_codon:yes gene_type:complete
MLNNKLKGDNMNKYIKLAVHEAVEAYKKHYEIIGKSIIEPDLELCDETLSGIMVLRSARYGYLAAVKDGEVLGG